MYPENPEGTQGNRRLNEHGIFIRHCQESNSQPVPPKREPIPLGHSDEQWRPQVTWVTWINSIPHCMTLSWCFLKEITSQFTLHYIACLIFSQNLATLLITWQLIQQFQECLIPYLIYKHRTQTEHLRWWGPAWWFRGEEEISGREGDVREQYPVRNHPHLYWVYSINCWIFSYILFERSNPFQMA